MLQVIRSKATSLVFKLLFAVLIVTFGVWGIGDIFRNRTTDTSVATVGDRPVRAEELSRAVRSSMERMHRFGGDIDIEKAKQLGLIDLSLQELIGRDLIDLEMSRLHLALGDEAVRQSILANPAFHNETGAFDNTIYDHALAQSRMNPQQFETLLRSDLVRSHLASAVSDGIVAPHELVDELYRTRAERRVADIMVLPASAAGETATPSDADLAAFHDEHQDLFRLPELRSFTIGLIRLDDLVAAGKDKISADQLRQEYDTRIDDFRTPEQRQLQQILLPDEAKAKEAEAQLATGKDFAETAKQLTNATPETIDLGWMKRSALPPQLADAVFSLKAGETTAPLQSSFGWHILRVVSIKPEETQPFDAVKDKLAEEMARDKAGDDLAKLANDIDDDLAAGKAIEEIADKRGLKLTKITDIDRRGRTASGGAVELPQPSTEVLRVAFETSAGQVSPLVEIPDNGYFVVHVDKVTASAVKPLTEVRDQTIDLWKKHQRETALEKEGKAIADAINGGKPLKAIAEERKLPIATTAPMQRTAGDARVPPALVAKLFELKLGQATTEPSESGLIVAQVKEIQQPDPSKDAAAVAKLAQGIDSALQNDLMNEFDAALRQHFPVTVNQSAVARLF